MPDASQAKSQAMLPVWRRAIHGSALMLALPVRRFVCRRLAHYCTPDRDRQGKVLILPGIEGRSPLNTNIVLGLEDAGAQCSFQIHDWTSDRWFAALHHLRDSRRHAQQADVIAAELTDYRRRFPKQPLHVIGHSGGAAMAVLALQRLPETCTVDTVCLLAGAVSPAYDLTVVLRRARRVINVYSPYDLFFLGVCTSIFGSLDGRRGISAGAVGFRPPKDLSAESKDLYEQRLEQRRFRWSMAASCWLGGHQGCTHRVFIERHVAPLLFGERTQPTNGPPRGKFRPDSAGGF